MMHSSFRLGRIAGIQVGINHSLFFIAALLIFWMVDSYYPERLPERPAWQYGVLGALTAFLLFGSILVHELAHALTARYFGLPVKQIILNWLGGAAIFEQEPRQAAHELWIALAGPLSTALLGGVAFGGGSALGNASPPGVMLLWLGQINLFLAVFNLLPGFPLDGGRVLRAGLWLVTGKYLLGTRLAAGMGQLLAFAGVMLAGYELFGRVNAFNALWMLLIAHFLWTAATSHLHNARLRHAVGDIPIQALIRRPVPLQPEWSVIYALDIMSISGMALAAPVMQGQEFVGIFRLESAFRVPKMNWGTIRVGALMSSLVGLPRVNSDSDVFHALDQMERVNADFLLVEENSRMVGILDRREVVRFVEGQVAP